MKGFDLFFIPKPFGNSTSWQDIHASEFNLFVASVFTVSQDKDSWIQFPAQHFIASSMN